MAFISLHSLLCSWLGCSAAPPSKPGTTTQIAQISGQIVADAFFFSVSMTGEKGQMTVPLILDTGAFEMLLSQDIATSLGLPNLGDIPVGGIGGSVQAYKSEVDVTLGNAQFLKVPCVVDPSFTGAGLFGLRFFIDNRLALTLYLVQHLLIISQDS